MFRRFIERVSRGRVVRRRLPADVGGEIVFVSPDSALQFWRGNLDKVGRDLFDFAKKYVVPGSIVWDVGANVGLFTFAAAKLAGPSGTVFAIEPDLFTAELMSRSRVSHQVAEARVIILPFAVGARAGIADFNIANRGRSASYLVECPGSTQTGGVRETIPVPLISLDWLATISPPPQVIKIDVETAEALVLQGASEVLGNSRPVILCEVAEECADAVTAELRTHRYELFDWGTRSPRAVERATWMTLAVPT